MGEKTKERKTYGLPPLTISEAARVVGTPTIAFMQFIEDVVRPSDSERSMWVRGTRDLPEELIRLYLMRQDVGKVTVIDPPPEIPPGPPSVAPPEPARARRRITTLSSRRRSARSRGEP